MLRRRFILRVVVPLALVWIGACNAVSGVEDYEFTRACSPEDCAVCDPAVGCVECAVNAHCTSELNPVCVDHRCVQCDTDLDRSGRPETPFCFQEHCAECAKNADCYSLLYGACKAGICVECLTASDCKAIGFGSQCQAELCICTSSADCTAPCFTMCNAGLCE